MVACRPPGAMPELSVKVAESAGLLSNPSVAWGMVTAVMVTLPAIRRRSSSGSSSRQVLRRRPLWGVVRELRLLRGRNQDCNTVELQRAKEKEQRATGPPLRAHPGRSNRDGGN